MFFSEINYSTEEKIVNKNFPITFISDNNDTTLYFLNLYFLKKLKAKAKDQTKCNKTKNVQYRFMYLVFDVHSSSGAYISGMYSFLLHIANCAKKNQINRRFPG